MARKAVDIPSLLNAVQTLRVSVSKARRICAVINHENQAHWIAQAETLSHRELEKEVAKENPNPKQADRSRYVSGDRIELRFDVSEITAKKFEEARDLVSQKLRLAASFEDTLKEALDEFLGEEVDFDTADLGTVPSSKLRKAVLFRDGRRCTFTTPGGRRCDATRWLDVHHIIPRAQGGSDDPANLTTLCTAHHRHLHSD